MRVLLRQCRMDAADTVVKEMSAAGVTKTSITFVQLIDGWARFGNMARANEYLNEAIRVLPNPAAAYNALLAQLSARNDLPATLQLFETMKSRNTKPDIITYNTVRSAVAATGDTVKLNTLCKSLTLPASALTSLLTVLL
eukprot:TRINITY_DN11949_c0_g1_i1.p1 TRINITY_DN11949_c0_g1~~TRINITY_DN11949_c0_g1_i1.p1  ORF type:complete len:140 (+),score=31.53 TRINITY_DN11949_c0_g1_i1:494-913(+)